VKEVKIALDGVYPSFWETDLVMRAIRTFCLPQLVKRTSAHDLLIRGPFAGGSRSRQFKTHIINIVNRVNTSFYKPVTLHVSSENHKLPNYQSFGESCSDFGIGHELIPEPSYFRMPHWLNYVDFSKIGISGPAYWPRLGLPISPSELTKPIEFNSMGVAGAAFVTSNMTQQRSSLMRDLSKVLPVDGFGKAFNKTIKTHSTSGFLKRDLLKNYQYCFCPENSLAPGYYTEKIPESFVSGAIPVTYCDPLVSIDFNPHSLINLADYMQGNALDTDTLSSTFLSKESLSVLLAHPLVGFSLEEKGSIFLDFVSSIIKMLD
jgi:hypothetical protein